MIQIIQHGLSRYEITCKICKCHFSFDKNDIEEVGPVYDRSVRIRCPDCGAVMSGWDLEDLVHSYK